MRARRLLLIGFAGALVLLGAAWSLRIPTLEWAVARAAQARGYEIKALEISDLSLSRISIVEFQIAGPGIEQAAASDVSATFHVIELLRDRRLETVRIGTAELSLRIDDGSENGGAGDGSSPFSFDAPPFERLDAPKIVVAFQSDAGAARAGLSIAYSKGDAARIDGDILLNGLRLDEATIATARGALSGSVDPDGRVRAEFRFSGTGSWRGANVDAFTLESVIDGGSWFDLAAGQRDRFAGSARMIVREATIDLSGAPMAQSVLGYIETEDVSLATLAAALDIEFAPGETVLVRDASPIELNADTGLHARLSGFGDNPLISLRNDRLEMSAIAEISGDRIEAGATVTAFRDEEGWSVYAPAHALSFRSHWLSMEAASIALHGRIGDGVYAATLGGEATISKLTTDAATVSGAAIDGVVEISGDDRSATATAPDCLRISRATAQVGDASGLEFRKVRLCADGSPLVEVDLGAPVAARWRGVVDVDQISADIGALRAEGAPPSTTFSGTYGGAANSMTARARLRGGALTLNDAARAGDADLTIDLQSSDHARTVDIRLDGMRLIDPAAAPKIAPIALSGRGGLRGDSFSFDFTGKTVRRATILSGDVSHDLATGAGALAADIGPLRFEPNGLQPEAVAPVLRGFIGEAEGGLAGEVSLSWSDDGAESGARLAIQDLSFRGPHLSVNRTIGLDGDLAFASLAPPRTAGGQMLRVAGVDFGALQLEAGEIRFALPGDETLVIESATFPWFGGSLNVDAATARLDGAAAEVDMRARDIDLAAVFEFVDVDGLSGQGVLNGSLPLRVEDGKARIVDGTLSAEGPGYLRYVGKAAAAGANENAEVAFQLLRDLQYDRLGVTVNGPLDGRLDFDVELEGDGQLTVNKQNTRVPVIYRINLDAPLLNLLQQVNVSRNIRLQLEQGLDGAETREE